MLMLIKKCEIPNSSQNTFTLGDKWDSVAFSHEVENIWLFLFLFAFIQYVSLLPCYKTTSLFQ